MKKNKDKLVEEAIKTAVIVSKEEAFWTDIERKTALEIETLEKMLKFNQSILSMCQEKIAAEKLRQYEESLENENK